MNNTNQNDLLIEVNLRGFDLKFKTTYDLFSAGHIDPGTRLLIDALEVPQGEKCLDLGCGYGPIGVVMGKLNPGGKIVLVDRDFVAVEYAKRNCELNEMSNFDAKLSNGLSHVKDGKFSLIASNLPTHIAKESIVQMFSDAKHALKPGGKFYIVTQHRLRPFIERELLKVFAGCDRVAQDREYVVLVVSAD